MDAPTVPPLPLDWVVAFVNEYAAAPRRAAGEADAPYPAPRELPEGDALDGVDLPDPAELAVLADRLHGAFGADPVAVAASLSLLLEDSGVRPRLVARSGRPRAAWIHDGAAPLAAGCALALWQHLTSTVGDRLGVCSASRCVDVYVDRSPAGARRYCSLTCQNRTKVAAFRARQQDPAGT
jgi:hypothetical protein